MLEATLTVYASCGDSSTILTYPLLGETKGDIAEAISMVILSLAEEGYEVTDFNVTYKTCACVPA